ncbi:unnamed protein product [Gadus morhua 'NCC']
MNGLVGPERWWTSLLLLCSLPTWAFLVGWQLDTDAVTLLVLPVNEEGYTTGLLSGDTAGAWRYRRLNNSTAST